MPDTTKAAADPATVALYEVAQRIDALTDAWKGDDLPPNLAEFVPEGPAGLRRLVLSELIKVDLEYRWRHHELPKQVEEYIEEVSAACGFANQARLMSSYRNCAMNAFTRAGSTGLVAIPSCLNAVPTITPSQYGR